MLSPELSVHGSDLPGALPDGFLELPQAIYRDDPCWIPEEADRVAAMLGPGSPWFEHGRAAAFCVPGACRASVSRTEGFAIDGVPSACFGHWETTGDAAAEDLVMKEVEAWARDAGAERLFGPIDLSTAHDYRVRLDAANGEIPYIGEPYNPPWYPDGLTRLGFRLVREFFGETWERDDLTELFERTRPLVDKFVSDGYRFDPLDARAWLDNSAELVDVVNAIFDRNYAFTPFTREAFERQFDEAWASTLAPEASLLVRGPDGDIAAVALVYPDYAPLVVQGAGADRVPLPELSYARHAPLLEPLGPRTLVFKTGGTSPRHRRLGLGGAGVGIVAERLLETGTVRMLGGPMREDNPGFQVFGGNERKAHRYGLYSRELAEGS